MLLFEHLKSVRPSPHGYKVAEHLYLVIFCDCCDTVARLYLEKF